MSRHFRIGQIVPSSNRTVARPNSATHAWTCWDMRASSRLATTYAMLHELDLERVLPGAGALLSGAY
jgi:maleate cis-trans isomerase